MIHSPDHIRHCCGRFRGCRLFLGLFSLVMAAQANFLSNSRKLIIATLSAKGKSTLCTARLKDRQQDSINHIAQYKLSTCLSQEQSIFLKTGATRHSWGRVNLFTLEESDIRGRQQTP